MVIAELVEPFVRNHPAADGWIVNRLGDNMAELTLPLIPLFVRLKGEQLGARMLLENGYTRLRHEAGHIARRVLTEAPYLRGDAGLSDEEFDGELRVDWRGKELRFFVLNYVGHYGETTVALSATKSRSALEDFWRELRVFQRDHDYETIRMWGAGRVPRGTLNWDDLVIPQAMKADLRCMVESFMGARPKYQELGLPWRRGLLLGGPPGCGKSTAIKVIAAQVKASVFVMPITSKTSDYQLSRFVDAAADAAPSVCVIEDLDRVVEGPRTEISMSNLLNLLDGIGTGQKQGVLLISTANHVDRLDPALSPKRPGRYDRFFNFEPPSTEERATLLRLRGKSRFSEEAVLRVADESKGYSHALVQELVVNALLKALNSSREASDQDLYDGAKAMREQSVAQTKCRGDLPDLPTVGFRGAVAA